MTLEQCWEAVPGGTATAALATARALTALSVDVVGVAARHTAPPAEPYVPSVPMAHLPLPRLGLYESWQRFRRPAVQRVTGPVDLVHATTMAVPPKSAPLVLTVHDLAFLADPSHFSRRGLSFFRRGLTLARRDADVVLVPSQAVQTDCVAAGFAPERLQVVPHGVDSAPATADDIARVRATYGLGGRYLLWTGTREPRKNLRGLLAAFRQLQADVDLVVVGPVGWGEDLGSMLVRTPRVRVTGFVPAADRDALYAGAELFAFPSLREGFGLPVLEAMAQGTAVVTSAGTAMAEFAVGALVDPADSGALADALDQLLADDLRRQELSARARTKAATMTWQAAAATTLAAYRTLLS